MPTFLYFLYTCRHFMFSLRCLCFSLAISKRHLTVTPRMFAAFVGLSIFHTSKSVACLLMEMQYSKTNIGTRLVRVYLRNSPMYDTLSSGRLLAANLNTCCSEQSRYFAVCSKGLIVPPFLVPDLF